MSDKLRTAKQGVKAAHDELLLYAHWSAIERRLIHDGVQGLLSRCIDPPDDEAIRRAKLEAYSRGMQEAGLRASVGINAAVTAYAKELGIDDA